MLRTADALYVTRLTESAHIFVGQTETVVAGTRRILYVADDPLIAASQLEGRDALALLLALEVDVVVLDRFAPRSRQLFGRSGEESGLASLFLDHQVPLLVGLHPVDVGIDGGIAPVEERSGLRQTGEGLVGIGVVHAVVLLLGTVQHRVVDEVAALLAVGPLVVGIPHDLGGPHAVDGRPVLVDALGLGIAEDGGALTVVETLRLPVYQVVGAQQADAVVVPLLLFLQVLEAAHVHIGTHHQVARAVVFATDIGVAGGPLDAGMLPVAEDGVAAEQVVIVEAVAA